MKKKKYAALALSMAMGMTGVLGCGTTAAEEENTTEVAEATEAETEGATDSMEEYFAALAAAQAIAQEEYDAIAEKAGTADVQAKDGTILVTGYEWGPGVNKITFELEDAVTAVSAENVELSTGVATRTVTNAYLSDAEGNEVSEASNFVTFEMETTYSVSGSPFTYDFAVTFQNNWSETYLTAGYFTVTGDSDYTVGFTGDLINNRLCPDTEVFTDRGSFSGNYVNPMTEETEELTLQYAAYEPDSLVNDGAKNPLIIWLHGQGEGGTDPDIALLGNEVVALAKDGIQSHFTTEGGEDGVYVLAVQTQTYWMDGGDGTNSGGDLVSRYTEILMDTIASYVESHPDVDTDRIYIGGCSNGGYMTMNMVVTYPDYWAAAYPNCEAYAFNMYEKDEDGNYVFSETGGYTVTEERWMTEEKIEAIKDLPIWFVQSADDTTVDPLLFGVPTYQALVQAGAENVWYSYFESVEGADDPSATYMGHWVWCYLFNDEVTASQDPEAVATATDANYGFVANNNGGGTVSPSDENGTYTNLFDWLNAQSK